MTVSMNKIITDVASQCRDLNFIFTKAKKLQTINQSFANYLDPSIQSQCQVANMVDKCLILIVTSGSIAMQMRLMTDEILQKIKQNPLFSTIKTIQCLVRPTQSIASTKQQEINNIPKLSHAAAKVIKESAESIKDPALQAIMLKISKRI
jgi:hypothetical protein